MNRLEALRSLRTTLSLRVEDLEYAQEQLTKLGFAKTLLQPALAQLEVALELVETAIRAENQEQK